MGKPEDKISLKSLLSGNFLSHETFFNQIPFILVLTILAVFYIANHFHAEKVLRDTQKLEKELHELRAESITRASRLMYMSKQSQVSKLIKDRDLGLEEAVTPPRQITVNR